ncbi:KICSTOR subunit 2-like [Cylas formicarius]|uniref:KICSTOR subunit 2-like n=1 Tax=Cylas formicarius TaxID=197179 RepID=UPI002958D4B2|nr:KICSTOR subunit 2-like [Cylas formicarius]
MEKEDEFLHTFFTHVSQMCFDKAREHLEKEKQPKTPTNPWTTFINVLQQLALAEKSYMDIGFLQNKPKSFLRKDNSLRSVYESMRNDFKKIDDGCRQIPQLKRLQNYCRNTMQFLTARISLIDFYEKIYNLCMSNKHMFYNEVLKGIEFIIKSNVLQFTDISMTPMKAVFGLECEVLQQLFAALHELQRLQFLPSLALIHGAHTRLAAWESKMQRETWKLGIFKNSPLPALFQWLQKLKGAVLGKFSLYFHNTLANQTTPSEMRHLCAKLHVDYYQRMVTFQRKYDAACVILLSDNQVNCDTTGYDSFPIIVSYPPRSPPQLDTILKMISDASDVLTVNKSVTKFSSQDQCTYCLSMVEPNIYFVILFESKKSDKDIWIGNFVNEFCTHLRCTKIFLALKNVSK